MTVATQKLGRPRHPFGVVASLLWCVYTLQVVLSFGVGVGLCTPWSSWCRLDLCCVIVVLVVGCGVCIVVHVFVLWKKKGKSAPQHHPTNHPKRDSHYRPLQRGPPNSIEALTIIVTVFVFSFFSESEDEHWNRNM